MTTTKPLHDDLLTCMALDRKLRRSLRAAVLSEHSRTDVRKIVTDTGKTLIASHPVAHGLIHVLEEEGAIHPGFLEAYAAAGGEALTIQNAGLTPLEDANFCIEAFRRTHGMPGPHPKLGPESVIIIAPRTVH